jgi:hypothetical protein
VQSLQRRAISQVTGGLAIGRDAPLADAGAVVDLFIAGVDQLFEIGIGDDALGQRAAGGKDAGVGQGLDPGSGVART